MAGIPSRRHGCGIEMIGQRALPLRRGVRGPLGVGQGARDIAGRPQERVESEYGLSASNPAANPAPPGRR